MILGLGVDAFEVSRMEQALRKGDPDFPHTLFTHDEIAYCQRQRRPAEHYAARFALKEAVFKALAMDGLPGASWRDIELCVHPGGARSVTLHGAIREVADRSGVGRVLVAIARTRGLALATAVLES
jgi:holo-[acyl-carrier protein] synthase